MRTSVRSARLIGSSLVLAAIAACASSDKKQPVGPIDPTPDDSTPSALPAGAHVVIDSRVVEVNQGRSRVLTARVVDAAGNTLSAYPVTFEAASTAPLSVSAAGTLTGLRPGAGQVKVKVEGETVDSVDVDVFGRPEGVPDAAATLGMRPFGVAVSRQGLVFITQLDAAQMTIGDLRSRTVGGSIAVGSVPTGVTFSREGDVAYVTNQYSGNVGVVKVANGQQVATIDVPGDPFVVRVGPAGDKLYVTSNASVVSIVDLSTRSIVEQIPVGAAPNSFAVAPNEERIYVASAFGSEVTEIRADNDQVTRRFVVNGVPQELVVSKDGKELYAANEAGWVDVIDLGTGTVVEHIELAGGGFGMALSPDQVHLYVSVPSRGLVQVVNTESRRVTRSINVGGVPRRIAFDYHGGHAVVANEAGGVNFVR